MRSVIFVKPCRKLNEMNENKISKEEALSLLFLLRADEFYILTRCSYRAFFQYSTFRLAHHAIEFYLKAGLSYFKSPKELKKIGHNLTSLYDEYKRFKSIVKIDERFIEHIDNFESMRYPGGDKFVRTAWGLSYQEFFKEIIEKVPHEARGTLAYICIGDIDHIVSNLRSSIPYCKEYPIKVVGEDQERFLYQENKYFKKLLEKNNT